MKRNSTKVGEPIPDEDHVVRYRKRDIWKMVEGRNFDPDIFESKRHPQAGISVNWLEYYGNDEKASLQEIRCSTTYGGIKTTGGFLKLKVEDIRRIGTELSVESLRVIYDGRCPNWSHAEVHPPGVTTFNALALCANSRGTVLRVPSLADHLG